MPDAGGFDVFVKPLGGDFYFFCSAPTLEAVATLARKLRDSGLIPAFKRPHERRVRDVLLSE